MDFFPKDFNSTMKDELIKFVDIVSSTNMPAKDLLDAVAGNRKTSHDLTPIHGSPHKAAKIPKKPGMVFVGV